MDNREREALRELTEAARGFIDGKPKTLRRLRNATTEAERALAEARAAIEGESRDSKCQVPVRENSKALIEKWRTAKNLSSDPARAMTYGYCADELEGVVTGLMGLIKLMRESTHPDAMVREQLKAAANLMEEIVGGRAERVLEAGGDKGAGTKLDTVNSVGAGASRGSLRDERFESAPCRDSDSSVPAAAAPLPIARELWDFEALGEVMDRILDGQRELTPAEQKNLRGIYDKLYRKVAAPQPVSEGRLREAVEQIVQRFEQEDKGGLTTRAGLAWAMYSDAKAALESA